MQSTYVENPPLGPLPSKIDRATSQEADSQE